MKFIEPIESESKKYLKDLVKNSRVYRMRIRAHAILLSERKYNIDALADIFDVHRDTVSRWIESWEKNGIEGLKDAPKPGRPRKFSDAEKNNKKLEYKSIATLRRLN